ncbi:MAG: LamG domain-containing protein [Treponema sp.]|nr:LamG domain-containing protein [Treponema sp.]
MKKLIVCAAALAAVALLAGCAKGGKSKLASDSSVVGYFTFDEAIENDEIVDHSKAKTNAALDALDGFQMTEGVSGQALVLDGTQYISLEDNVLSGEGLTMAAWVKVGAWKTWQRVFDIGGGDGTKDVFLAVDGRMAGTFCAYEQSSAVTCNAPLTPIKKWTHLAMTIGNGKMALYVNGALAEEKDMPVSIADLAAGATGIFVGRSNWVADPLLEGAIDEVVVAKRAFSAEEINEIYSKNAQGSAAAVDVANAQPFVISADSNVTAYYSFDGEDGAKDVSGAGNDSVTNATEYTDGKNGKALLLNGAEQFIDLNQAILTGNGFTFSAWVKSNGMADWSRIFDMGDAGGNDWWLGKEGGSGKIRLDVNNAKGSVSVTGPVLEDGVWTHIAVTIGDEVASLFVNGKLVMNNGSQALPTDLLNGFKGAYIGRSNWPDPYAIAEFDDVLFASRAYSETEVASLYKGISK